MPQLGQVRVCGASDGATGWLFLSQTVAATTRHRRSKSTDAEVWLDHRPGHVLELATIFQVRGPPQTTMPSTTTGSLTNSPTHPPTRHSTDASNRLTPGQPPTRLSSPVRSSRPAPLVYGVRARRLRCTGYGRGTSGVQLDISPGRGWPVPSVRLSVSRLSVSVNVCVVAVRWDRRAGWRATSVAVRVR